VSVCNQCGLEWTPRVANPRACPGCKRYNWNEPKKGAKREVVQDRVGKERVPQVPRSRQQTPEASGKGLPDLRNGAVGGGEKGVVRSHSEPRRDEETIGEEVSTVRETAGGEQGRSEVEVPRKVGVRVPEEVEDLAPEDHPLKPECGFESYNETDGETYRCTLPAHGIKVKHGGWVKV